MGIGMSDDSFSTKYVVCHKIIVGHSTSHRHAKCVF